MNRKIKNFFKKIDYFGVTFNFQKQKKNTHHIQEELYF